MVSSRNLLMLCALISAFAAPTKRDAGTVEADIANIATQTTTLDNAINSFPNTGGTLLQALTIHNDAVALTSTVKGAATDAQAAGAFSETDGNTILTSIQNIKPTILDALTVIVQKKPAFQALPVGGITALILQDLTFLNGNVSNFGNALIADSPADLVPTATQIKSDIAAAFATAIAAYSS